MKELFYQKGDCRYAQQSEDGTEYFLIRESISDELYNSHLSGGNTIGAYTTFNNNCIFGVWDLDINKEVYLEYESPQAASKALKQKLRGISRQFNKTIKYRNEYIQKHQKRSWCLCKNSNGNDKRSSVNRDRYRKLYIRIT